MPLDGKLGTLMDTDSVLADFTILCEDCESMTLDLCVQAGCSRLTPFEQKGHAFLIKVLSVYEECPWVDAA